MSRLNSMSPAALRALLAPEADDDLIVLLTLSGANITTPIRLADGYTQRLSETATDIVYGVRSRGVDYMFLPLQITLPDEQHGSAPRCSVTIHDVSRQLIPVVRGIVGAPTVTLELVLASSPDAVEAEFPALYMSGIEYDADTVSGELTTESLSSEPFPAHTFTPSICPGLF